MKRVKYLLALVALFGAFTVVSEPKAADAEYTNFSIKAGWTYNERSSANFKEDDAQHAYVIWDSSDASDGVHNEWFQVVDSSNKAKGDEQLFSHLESDYLDENQCTKKYGYYLRARREHIINPATTVKGTWES